MPDGWRCPECGLILAPSVAEHRCDPPAADVTITMTNSGATVLSSAQITDLTQAIQRQLLRQAKRNAPSRRLA